MITDQAPECRSSRFRKIDGSCNSPVNANFGRTGNHDGDGDDDGDDDDYYDDDDDNDNEDEDEDDYVKLIFLTLFRGVYKQFSPCRPLILPILIIQYDKS